MLAIVIVQAVATGILTLLVAGLLRSHAEILTLIHGEGVAGQNPARDISNRVADGVPAPRTEATPAFDLVGTTPRGDAVKVGVTRDSVDTVIAFLSSGCLTCQEFWRVFREQMDLQLPHDARLAIVTKDITEESPSAILELAPSDIPVVMSSETWKRYAVPLAPYFIYVDGETNSVLGEGAASNWEQMLSLLSRATGDLELIAAANEKRAKGRRGFRKDRDARRQALMDEAARVDRELLAAGITPGHPSLYPQRPEDLGGELLDPR